MATIYVKAVGPCIFDDQDGHSVDMSHTEFSGKNNWQGLDPVTGEDISGDRKANPDKVYKVIDSKYWLDLIAKKRLMSVEKPNAKKSKANEEESNEENGS